MITWAPLKSGEYNDVYKSSDGLWVLKIQKSDINKEVVDLDTPERSVRIWNELNPDFNTAYVEENTPYGKGWVCPFIAGEQASNTQIFGALIQIFNQHGRIVIDAPSSGNFLVTSDKKVVCVDVGMCLQLEQRTHLNFTQPLRRASVISRKTMHNLKGAYDECFTKTPKDYSLCVKAIKALLFIKNYRPKINNAGFLFVNNDLLNLLAGAYDKKYVIDALMQLDNLDTTPTKNSLEEPGTIDGQELQELNSSNSIVLSSAKSTCSNALDQYIYSRGWLSKDGLFSPSRKTLLFRDTMLTNTKVQCARALKRNIQQADTLEEMDEYIHVTNEFNNRLNTKHTVSGLGTSLAKCHFIVTLTKQQCNQIPAEVNSTDNNCTV